MERLCWGMPVVFLQVRHYKQLLCDWESSQAWRRPASRLLEACVLQAASAHHARPCKQILITNRSNGSMREPPLCLSVTDSQSSRWYAHKVSQVPHLAACSPLCALWRLGARMAG